MRKQIIILLFISISFSSTGQTCCSGGVPIAANVGMPSGSKGGFQFSLNYDINTLKTLKTGDIRLEDQLRERITKSVLFGVSYSFTDRISIDGFFSYVNQQRIIRPAGLPVDHLITNGLGDAVVLGKYLLTKPGASDQFMLGIGVKLPTGPSDLKRNGITLNADVQPGSGAWDGILWMNFIKNVGFRKSMNINTTVIYRGTGENPTYFGSQVYELGNELQIKTGVSDRILLGGLIFDPSLSFRYRGVSQDVNDGLDLPNTGGKWVFIIPAISYLINNQISLNATLELPLYANVDGTQLSPTHRLNMGVFWILPKKSKGFNELGI